MNEERRFLAAIRDEPEDRTTRLVYADWLEEHDDARGELIRAEEESRTVPIHSDRYWELKPRRKALLKSAQKPWLKQMGYGDTDYQPVFADVPAGWKERWRLLREFVERWYRIPMGDAGGPLKPLPRRRGRSLEERDAQTVDDTLNAPKVRAALPPSLREWVLFVRDLQVGMKGFEDGSGNRHIFHDSRERIGFLQLDGGRQWCFVRDEHRREPDPPVWWDWATPFAHQESARLIAPRLSTLALHYLLTQHDPEFGMRPFAQKMTKAFARRLAEHFPVRSDVEGTLIFERPNVIVLWIPQSLFTGEAPHLQVKVRPPATPNEVYDQLWD